MSTEFPVAAPSAGGEGAAATFVAPQVEPPAPPSLPDLGQWEIAGFDAQGNPLPARPIGQAANAPVEAAPAPQEQAPAAPEAPQPQQPLNLNDIPEFRKYQSARDRERAELQRELAATRQQLGQLTAAQQEQVRQAQRQERLQNVTDPAERQRVEAQLDLEQERESVEQQRARLEAQQAFQQDLANLNAHAEVYVNEWGIPLQVVQQYTQLATNEVRGYVERGELPKEAAMQTIHLLRDAQIKQLMGLAQAQRPRPAPQAQQPAPQQQYAPAPQYAPVQQPQGYGQQPPPSVPAPQTQPVARPASTAPTAASLPALVAEAQRTGKWDKVYQATGRSINR
jgi:hypothetical protein